MPTVIRLTDLPNETSFAPLGVLGYCLTRAGFLAPVWAPLQLPLKTVDHAPEAKLQDLIVSVLAGCRSISQINTRLRPDVVLARAWRRSCFADQSTIARTLDTFTESQVTQLRQGSEAVFRQHSCVLRHDFEHDWLWLDIDLTPLPISKHAEGSTKGKFAKKTATVGNWRVCMRPSITRPSSRGCTPASRTVARPISLSWTPWDLALA
jgi:hypothetical protein